MRSKMVVPIYHGSIDTGAGNRSNLLSLLLWLLRFIRLLQITWVLKKVLCHFQMLSFSVTRLRLLARMCIEYSIR